MMRLMISQSRLPQSARHKILMLNMFAEIEADRKSLV